MTKYLRCIKTESGHTEGRRYKIVQEYDECYEVETDVARTELFSKEPDNDGDSFRNWFVLETEGGESMENVIEIDGVKYREVKRKAAVGETIKIINAGITLGKYENGDIRVVTGKHRDYPTFEIVDGVIYAKHEEYVVLEPITEYPRVGIDAERELVDLIVLQREINEIKRQQAELTKQIDGLTDAFAKLALRTSSPAKTVVLQEKPKSRDEIVAQAKRDVAELLHFAGTRVRAIRGRNRSCFWPFAEGADYIKIDRVKYEVNRNKRTVVALVYDSDGVWARGIAKAAPGDVFNSHIGRAIALRRALGLPVPTEYTNAPQPTEPRVGDVVYKNCGIVHGKRTLLERVEGYKHDKYGYNCFLTDRGGWIGDKQFVIIDDSREDGGVSS